METDLATKQNSIENSKLRLEISPNGKITITDKMNNQKYANFIEFEDRADVGDTYNFSPVLGDNPIKADFLS